MSTTNERESDALPASGLTLDPHHSVSHANATALGHASMLNGNVYTTNTHIHNHFAGNLDSSVRPSSSTSQGGSRTSEPTNLSGAKRQIQALETLQSSERVASPGSDNRPNSASHRSVAAGRRTRGCSGTVVFGKVTTWALTITVFIVWPLGFMMLAFTAGHRSPEQTLNVRHGFFKSWVDHSHAGIWQRRVTLSEYQVKLITGLAILILTLSITSAYILFYRITARIIVSVIGTVPRGQDTEQNNHILNNRLLAENQDVEGNDDNEETPLLNRKQEGGFWPRILYTCSTSKSLHSSIKGFAKLVSRQKISDNEVLSWSYYLKFVGRVLLASLFSLLALTVFFGLAIGAIMSTNIVTDSVVLSEHPDCGLWVRDPKVLSPSPTGYDYLQEVEAGAYAKKCYHSSPGTDGCNTFFTQNIPYNNYSNRQCPFEESFCLEGQSAAYTLATGHVSSKDLGINVEIGYTFNRITTCAPVRRRATLSQDGKSYEYDYGNTTSFGNITWRSSAKTSWEFAGYNVATFYYKADSSNHDWIPSSEFKPSAHNAITLLLIQSQNNYYTSPQHDPIFPAKRSLPPYPGRAPLYFNDDPTATALACVDTTEICDASGNICYDNIYKPYPDLTVHDEEIGYYMLLISLMESTTFDAIQLLGGRALVAEAKLERQVSLPLADEQWKVEVENLFETTLVRPQITLRDYIRGTAAKDPEYTDRTLAGMHDMCKTYKLRGQGWKNVSVWGMVMLVFIVVVLYALSIEVRGSPIVYHWCDEEAEGQGFEAEEEECYCRQGQQTITVAEWILNSILGTTTEAAENGEVEGGSQRAVSREGTDVGRASPRICVSGPSHQESPTPENPGSSVGQDIEAVGNRSDVGEQRRPSTGENIAG